jgi:4-aminobutyrate aminotransferase-like enzyme
MRSDQILALLRDHESPNVTFIDPEGSWPIVWDRAKGVHVWDANGKKYLDLTAAFGVAAAGHANPRVIRAGQRQMARLLHAMGDVHPHALKARLARELSRITFERWSGHPLARLRTGAHRHGTQSGPARVDRKGRGMTGKAIFCNSGFEAVEAALKTATLATGKPGVIAFTGAYHGVGYGALNTTHRAFFRAPFLTQLARFGHFVEFPNAIPPSGRPRSGMSCERVRARLDRLLFEKKIGAVLVEPIQVRGGINIPPDGFLSMLRRACSEHRALLILDEIYTGFGRTGKWFACEHERVTPDVICLGKALTGGFPLSACVGRADLMDAAWPKSYGEAIHTSTFLGHPVGCAMALAQIQEIDRLGLVNRSARFGKLLLARLETVARQDPRGRLVARGLGQLAGLEVRRPDGAPDSTRAMAAIKAMLHRGFILLPEGDESEVISFSPPLTISAAQLRAAVESLEEVLQ